ncbi:XRE family transcriptional regulator, partial [Patescibacteria group bacterium]|nr:XRE family transcriptional regulator [Patescibacteria group bacterium]
LNTDPEKHPDVSPRDVFDADARRARESDVTVAEVTYPSLGTGGEIAIADAAGKHVVLLSRKDAKVTRFVKGNPAVVYHIEYDTNDEACRMLKNVLKQL